MVSHYFFYFLLSISTSTSTTTTTTTTTTTQYGLQFDAGSSGTRVYIYQWPQRSSAVPSTLPAPFQHDTSWPRPVQVNGGSLKISPGLSAYVDDGASAGDSLAPLFAFANATLAAAGCDASCRAQTPAFLGATAGMRVLSVAAGEAIMDSVRAAFSSSGFRCDDPSDSVRIISGEEEGAFGWLAANWLAGTLTDNNDDGDDGSGGSSSSSSSIGALDLGGASTQISFTPRAGEPVLASYFPVSLNGLSVGLYTHSYLYFGRDQALLRQQEALAAAGMASNPCFPAGSNDTAAPTTPCTAQSGCLPGSSNATACAASARAVFLNPPRLPPRFYASSAGSSSSSSSSSSYSLPAPATLAGASSSEDDDDAEQQCLHADGTRCGFLGEYQPATSSAGQLYAFSNFYYTWSFLGAGPTSSLQVMH